VFTKRTLDTCAIPAMLPGWRAQVWSPGLSQPVFCRTCVYQLPCWEDGGWEKRHLVDPGMLAQAERLRDMIRDVRRAISGDGLAAQQLEQKERHPQHRAVAVHRRRAAGDGPVGE
jgi:hypothetical protein